MDDSKLMTVPQVAERLGLPEYSTYALIRERKIPHLKIGRRIRVRGESLERWIRENESTGAAAEAGG